MKQIFTQVAVLEQKAEQLNEFIQHLLNERLELNQEIANLKKENAELKKRNSEGASEWNELNIQYKMLQLENEELKQKQQIPQFLTEIKDKDALKVQIDHYLQNIDNCLKIFGE